MLIRFEGRDVSAEEALQVNRHIRVIKQRKQIVQVLTANAWLRTPEEIKSAYPFPRKNSYVHANEGYFRSLKEGTYYFTSTVGENSKQKGPRKYREPIFLLSGQYVPMGAALRQGHRTLFCPDQIIDHTKAYRIFQVSGDDGTVEGVVKQHRGGQLVIETTICPTGEAKDFAKKDVTVKLDPDAEYHLNGVVGFSSQEKIDTTTSFRFLRFTILEGTSNFSRGIQEIRYLVGDKEIGVGSKIVDSNRGAEILFDGKTNKMVKWMSGRSATIDCGKQIAPTGFKIWSEGGNRGVRSFRIEGAKGIGTDGLTWVELLQYDAGKGKAIPKRQWFQVPIDLSNVDAAPLTINKTLVPGSFVRVLPALPNGAILVRENKGALKPKSPQ